MGKNRTVHYALINIFYFAAYSGAHAYAAVFLLDRGFSNTLVGVILALANILSVVVGPIWAGIIDKYASVTNRRVSMACATLCAVLCIMLYFVNVMAIVFIMYVILYTLQMAYQPLIQAMNFEYTAKGDKINFGLARGLGSCGFAVTSLFTGRLVAQSGVDKMLIVNVVIFAVGAVLLLTFKNSAICNEELQEEKIAKRNDSLWGFVKTYPVFMLFVFGGACLFFSHNALNDYLIQIITPIGGNEEIMGRMVMLAACLELPAMALFEIVRRKVGIKKILILSAVMFTVKSLIMFLASNLIMAYISQVCQMFAYALFIPGAAYLAENIMEQGDKTKGQAYTNMAITLGGVFSALVCGRALDQYGTHTMLGIATALGAAGTVIMIISILLLGKNKEH
ncbi:MAG: MFS transporter [Lachnospiraceae bacterium]|nr:MFS transporter [Candidatus Colinaster equi]